MFYFENISRDYEKRVVKSDLLSGLEHFFTTRETCIRGEDSDFEENKDLLCDYLNVSVENFVCPSQTHSENVAVLEIGQTSYPQTDALILADYEAAIFLNFADCTPIILWDEVKNVAAIAHAGWRGTAKKIAAKTVLKMKAEFCSNPKDIKAVIGPAIGDCCYCVGDEVYLQLKESVSNFEGCFKEVGEKLYTNLKKINYRQLVDVGVEKIDVCNYCTSCSNELFFSYRKENGTSSRHSAVVKLNKRERE